jgi:hypothetical protein
LLLLKGTFLTWSFRNSMTPEWLLFEEQWLCVCDCVFFFVCFCTCVCVCVCVCVFVCVFAEDLAHREDQIILLLSGSVRYPFSKSGRHDCFLEVNNFREIKLTFL